MYRKCIVIILSTVILLQLTTPGLSAADSSEDLEDCCDTHNRVAVLETDYGVIKFLLYENMTPITTDNFIELAERGHYDGVVFHRIVKDFVIQTGDGGGGQTIPLEIHPNATHIDGAIGMARSSDPDSASDQFYICDGPQHGLDGDYAVFGVVIEGMEVVREIASVPVYGENNPRPGSVIPPIWYNLGVPKEDVFVQTAYIENLTTEETDGGADITVTTSGSRGAWAAAILIPMLIAVVYLKQKQNNKKREL